LDAKGRAFVPAKFKDGLNPRFMLTKGLGNCLVGYPMDEWLTLTKKLRGIPLSDREGSEFKGFFIGSAFCCEPDPQWRFGIDSKLREYAQLTKEIVFVGQIDYFQVWDAARWNDVSAKYDSNADVLAEKMQKYLFRDEA
jgi:MraZ protein